MKDFLTYIILVSALTLLLLSLNFFLASHNPYLEKNSVFECGFHSFLGQTRTQFAITFFIFALLFLLFDLEILLFYPFSMSNYAIMILGLIVALIFFLLLCLGFIYELGKGALSIESRQLS